MFYNYKSKFSQAALVILSFSAISYATSIPQKISYQGKLLDSGIPVTGTKSMTFSLGSSWSETHPNVSINDGLYSIQLGSVTPIPVSVFSTDANLSLQISVDDSNLTPTLDMLTVPYAFVAEKANDANKLNGEDASHYLDWANLVNVPEDFADGVDNTASEGISSETDPVFNSSASKNITATNIGNWNSAALWGNHALAGYIKNESDPIWSAVAANYYTKNQISAVGTSNDYNDLINKPTVPDTSSFVTLAGTQTVTGAKNFDNDITFNDYAKFYKDIELYNDGDDAITFRKSDASLVGEVGYDVANDGTKVFRFNGGSAISAIQLHDDVIIGGMRSDSSTYWSGNGELTVVNEINAYDDIVLFRRLNGPGNERTVETGKIFANGDGISIWPENPEGYGVNIKGLQASSNGDDEYLKFGNYIKFTEGNSWSGDLNLYLGSSNNKLFKVYGGFEVTDSTPSKPGGGSWSASSDRRLKDIGNSYSNGLDKVSQINPIYYNYKKDNALKLPSQEEHVGLIAQEVQKVIPEAVKEDKDGYLTVNNDPVIWAMVNAIKELNDEVKKLKTEINRLKKAEK